MSTTIESLELEIKSKSKSATDGIANLIQSLEKLRTATKGGVGLDTIGRDLSKINEALNPAAKQMKKFSDSLKDASESAKNLAKSNDKSATSSINLGVKLAAAYLVIKKGISVIGRAISITNDYIEDVNLFTVSMGKYADEAKEYSNTVSEAMGINPADWMRNQGIVMTLATGFGVASDRAYVMSKNLTQLGYDLSSFFNLSYEDAMQKLQSGLSGELEPLRRIGYDLSQAKLEAIALSLGIDKAVSSMTQAEKAELRYYAIMTQVTVAHGDMARTLNAPANQLKVLKSQVTMAGQAIGSILIPALNAILPYAIAVVKVFTFLANAIANLFGFEMPEVDYSGVTTMGNAAEDTSSALSDATDSAKKLKSYMMGFDELNVINPNTDSSVDSGVDSSAGGLGFELPEYDFLKGLAESRVGQIVSEMKEWLGLTEDIDSWSELLDTRLGNILTTVGLIGLGFAGWKIYKGFLTGIATLEKILNSPSRSIAVGLVVTLVGIKLTVDGIKDAIENGLDGFNLAEIIGGSLLTVGGAALLGAKIATWIDKAFGSSKIALAIVKAGINLGTKTVAGTGAAIAGAVTAIIVGIPAYIVGIYDAIKDGLDWLNGLLISAGATLAGAGIGAVIGMLGGPIGAGIGALIGLAVGLVTDLVILIVQKWDEISAWFVGVGKWFNKNVIQPIFGFFKDLWDGIVEVWNTVATWFNKQVIQPVVKFFKGLWESVSGFFKDLWDGIVGVWNTVATWFDENVIQPIVNFFAPIVERISQFFYGCWLIIQAVWVVVSTWFNEHVIQPVVGFFKSLWETVSGFFTELWNDIVNIWVLVSTWFEVNVIQPVAGFFKSLWETVSGFFVSLWEDIKGVWKTVSNWFDTTVIQPVVGFFKGAWESISGFFTNLWKDIKGVWKTVATWFDNKIVEPVKTAFDTACEAIGGFFSKMWLGIRIGAATAINGLITAVEWLLNKVVDGINALIGGFNKVVQWAADVLGADWGGITLVKRVEFGRVEVPTYAQGGYPESGQAFIARENGIPEMVGTIGRRTAVANNEQIVESVASGVAEANHEQNVLLREQNELLRALLAKDSGVYLDGRSLSNSVDKYKREHGRVLISGGAL